MSWWQGQELTRWDTRRNSQVWLLYYSVRVCVGDAGAEWRGCGQERAGQKAISCSVPDKQMEDT